MKTESPVPCLGDSTMEPETIRACVPLLYTQPADPSPGTYRSSYAMKHDVEHLLERYVSNDDLKGALRDTVYYRSDRGDANFYFCVKPKFDLHWLRSPPTTRPKGARKSHWEAYQFALAQRPQQEGS